MRQIAWVWMVVLVLVVSGCGGGGGGGESTSPTIEKVTVTGRILDTSGNPVGGATVTITSDPVVTTTDSQGRFSSVVEEGNHQLTVEKGGLTLCQFPFATKGGDEEPLGDIATDIVYYDAGTTWYQDADGDGYSEGTTVTQNTQPPGHQLADDLAATSGDCDDTDAALHPGAQEVFDAVDNDCDGVIDEDTNALSLTRHAAFTESPSKVTMLFSVAETGSKTPVIDLDDGDFQVLEGSTPITTSEHFREVLRRESLPYALRTVLLIDVSTSIRDNLDTMKAAARQFVAVHDPDTGALVTDPTTAEAVSNLVSQQTVRIYVFDDGVREVTNGWTSDAESLLAAIDSIGLGGPTTNLYGAIDTGLRQWSDEASPTQISQGFLIGITDGVDTAAIKTLSTVKTTRASKRVYMLGVGDEVDPAVLADIAATGAYFPLADFSEVRGALQTVQQRMEAYANSFYYFYYASPKRSGTHTVTLEVVGNANTGSDRQISYDFSADGFSSVRPEITVVGDIVTAVGIGTELRAKTWWGLDPPTHTWALADPSLATLAVNPLDPSVATLTGLMPGQSTLTITDTTNTYYASTDPQYGQNVSADIVFAVGGTTVTGDGTLGLGADSVLTAQTVSAQYTPAYTWEVADEAVATLSATTGSSVTLTGAGYGATTVTVTDTANGYEATLQVRVSDLTIEVLGGSLVDVGDTVTLQASHPGAASTPSYTWTVTDPAACSLDVATGDTVVVTLDDAGLNCEVALQDLSNSTQTAFAVGGITVAGDGTLGLDETSVLTAQTVSAQYTPAYTWEVADEAVATLSATTGSSVTLTGAGYGATTVTVTDTANGYEATLQVRVSDLTIEVLGGSLVDVGDTVTLQASHPGAASTPSYTWTVTDPAACSLDVATGDTVVVTLDDAGARCEVGVSDAANQAAQAITLFGGAFEDPVTGMQFTYVPPGTFTMGDEFGDGWSDEMPTHPVTISKGFYLGTYEVTQAQWEAVMGSNPSSFSGNPDHPVETVSWDDVQGFIAALNTANGNAGCVRGDPGCYYLPTEAQWEYAAKGGPVGTATLTKYAGSDVVDDVAWCRDNGYLVNGYTTYPVGTKLPNELGLYDMSGNVYEWVQDWYSGSYYGSSPATDPAGPASGSYRVGRGGSWLHSAVNVRVANRGRNPPGYRGNDFGFRLALE